MQMFTYLWVGQQQFNAAQGEKNRNGSHFRIHVDGYFKRCSVMSNTVSDSLLNYLSQIRAALTSL